MAVVLPAPQTINLPGSLKNTIHHGTMFGMHKPDPSQLPSLQANKDGWNCGIQATGILMISELKIWIVTTAIHTKNI